MNDDVLARADRWLGSPSHDDAGDALIRDLAESLKDSRGRAYANHARADEARAEVERLRADAARYCPHYPDCCTRADALEEALRDLLADEDALTPVFRISKQSARDALAKHGRGGGGR